MNIYGDNLTLHELSCIIFGFNSRVSELTRQWNSNVLGFSVQNGEFDFSTDDPIPLLHPNLSENVHFMYSLDDKNANIYSPTTVLSRMAIIDCWITDKVSDMMLQTSDNLI